MLTRKDTLLKVLYAFGIALGIIGIVIGINLNIEVIPELNYGLPSVFTFVLIVVDIIALTLLFIGIQGIRKHGLERSLKRLFFIGLATFIVLWCVFFVFRVIGVVGVIYDGVPQSAG